MNLKERVPYCIASSLFFDVPERLQDDTSRYGTQHLPNPDRWKLSEVGLYMQLTPPDVKLPPQGWKIHISASLSNAESILAIVWEHCVNRGIVFKFLRSRDAVLANNSKYWNRASSGKFITLYPANDGAFVATLSLLAPKLSPFDGPYVLSDLRFGHVPMYVRYGAFSRRWCTDSDGTRVLAISTPEGELVPDRRAPTFSVPKFVPIPAVLEPYLQDPLQRLENFPYQFESALHYSNAGGIYLAKRKSSDDFVIIREARPYAGLDSDGRDSVERLENESRVLVKLLDLTCVPRFLDKCKVWEHHFLVQERIEGATLLNEIIARYPHVHSNVSSADLQSYVDWGEAIFEKLREAVGEIHARGIRIGDLHPSNIILSPSGRVVFVDLECASDIANPAKSTLGAPGFGAPAGTPAMDADFYSLACVRLMIFLPLVSLLNLDRRKSKTLIDVACASLPIAECTRITLTKDLSFHPSGITSDDPGAKLFSTPNLAWKSIRDSLAAGIWASATPHRDDRLFPGDPLQFSFGGATLAYGASGVLLALLKSAVSIPTTMIEWLSRTSQQEERYGGSGLYDGPCGAAYVLDLLGATEDALRVLCMASERSLPRSLGLFGGRSGVALTFMHFGRSTGRDEFNAHALRIADDISIHLISDVDSLESRHVGLMHGYAGVALLMIHVYDQTREERYLDAAERALMLDLEFGTIMADGTHHTRLSNRYLAYLDEGSAGIGLVLARFLRRRENVDFRNVLAAIRGACKLMFVTQPGLFQGRAGLIACLCDVADDAGRDPAVEDQTRRLAWHAIDLQGSVVFPGTSLLRLSSDLATGSAGILMALRCALDDAPLNLPFLNI